MVIILLYGCNTNQSMDDYYNQESKTESVSENMKSKEIYFSYDKVSLGKDVRIVSEGEDVDLQINNELTQRECRDINISVIDSEIGFSIYDIEKYAGYDESEFISKIEQLNEIEGGLNYHLLENGTFTCPIDGINSQLFLLKVIIKNESDAEVYISLGNIQIVRLDNAMKNYESIGFVNDFLFDKMTSTDGYKGFCEIQPNETIETILMYIYPEQRIDSYLSKNGVNTVMNKSEYDYENLYLRCNATGNLQSESGEYYIKLDMTRR